MGIFVIRVEALVAPVHTENTRGLNEQRGGIGSREGKDGQGATGLIGLCVPKDIARLGSKSPHGRSCDEGTSGFLMGEFGNG